MAKGSKNIYGCDSQEGVDKIVSDAMRCMKKVQSTAKSESPESESASDSHDITENLGRAKP